MLEIQSLKKSFGTHDVLRDISATFQAGAVSGIIGGSGAGKTVLAKCLTGLISADDGIVRYPFDGLEVTHPPASDVNWTRIRRRINYVSQTRAVAPYRKVLELVAEGPKHVLELNSAQANDAGMELLKEYGVDQHAQKYPTEVSGGELTRICIARSLSVRPQYLICDEIFANLDPIAAHAVGEALLRVTEIGVGVILISHQLGFLRTYGKHLIYIRGGVVIEAGMPHDVLGNPSTPELRRFVELSGKT